MEPLQYVPASQSIAELMPSVGHLLPSGQARQDVCLAEGWYWPALQRMCDSIDDDGHLEPLGQSDIATIANDGQKNPLAQFLQLDFFV